MHEDNLVEDRGDQISGFSPTSRRTATKHAAASAIVNETDRAVDGLELARQVDAKVRKVRVRSADDATADECIDAINERTHRIQEHIGRPLISRRPA